MTRRLPAILAVVCAATPLAAQAPVHLDDLVITASRAPVDSAALPVAVTVLRGDSLRARGMRFLADALAELPSLVVTPTGSWGGVSSLFLRGGESDYVKVLVDGVPLNGSGGYVDFGTITLDNIDRIEVVRGPASVVHGSDAMTGVVQLFSRPGAGVGTMGGGVSGGSDATRQADAWLRLGAGALTATLDGGWSRTDGTQPFNGGFDQYVVGGRASWAPGARTSVTGGVRHADHTSEFPTDFTGTPVDSNQANTGRSTQVDLRATHWFGNLEANLVLGWRDATAGYRNDPDSPGDTLGFGYAGRQESDTERVLADARLATRLRGGTVALVGGMVVDRVHEARTGTSTSNFGDGAFTEADLPFDEARTTLGWYGEGSWVPLAHTLVQAGLRLDDSDAFGTFLTWRTGAGVMLSPSTRMVASLGTAFKAPALAESYASSPFERGNPDLEPEESLSWEVGLRQALAADGVILEGRWFDQRFRDLIQYHAPDATSPTYFNLAEATARGMELEATALLVPGLRIQAGYTRLWSDVVEGGPEAGGGAFEEGKPLLRRPAHQGTLGVVARPVSALAVGATLRYLGARDDLDFSTFPSERVTLDAVTVTDLDARWRLEAAGGLLLTARLENVFNAQYQTIVGYPARGRAAFVGIRFGP